MFRRLLKWLFGESTYVEVLCLANSRKYQGRCFAGLLMDGSGWIRPVSRDVRTHGALRETMMRLPDGSIPKPLDVVAFRISRPLPLPFQRENWQLAGGDWRLLEHSVGIKDLEPHTHRGPALLGSTSDREPADSFDRAKPQPSLALIRPDGDLVTWHRTRTHSGNHQLRATFRLGRQPYNLVVTDPEWEARVPLADGIYNSGELGIPSETRLLLTISLGEPFNGHCYKLVAAVLAL